MRKIVHVDMDAFYASIEQRDNPALRGKPVVVAWRGARSVVCAASYEARKFGVYSAMPALRAERLCPQAVFVAPDFGRYRTASRLVREIFLRHTALVEPLSLDEAYLDVTVNHSGLPSATAVAQAICAAIAEEVQLTASAGVAPNKFLAKIASDVNKPNGIFVIKPADVEDFLATLPVGRIPGVGKVTQDKMKSLSIHTAGDLRGWPLDLLTQHFGKYGARLHQLARGEDHHPVCPERPTMSISAEDTYSNDVALPHTEASIRSLAQKVWAAAQKQQRPARTVVLKLKTQDFRLLTRSHTPEQAPASAEELAQLALALRDRVGAASGTLFRLVGVGLSNFNDAPLPQIQPKLF